MLVAQLVPLAATVAAAGAEGGQEEAWGSLVAHDLQRPKHFINTDPAQPRRVIILIYTLSVPRRATTIFMWGAFGKVGKFLVFCDDAWSCG